MSRRRGPSAASAPPTCGRRCEQGWEDFLAIPTQLVFLCVLYPLVGLVAARAFSGGDLLPLLWPLVAGLSLVGPVAAVGLYEISRRREAGEEVSWLTAFAVLRHPNLPQIAMLGIMLMAIFVAWVAVAKTDLERDPRPAAADGVRRDGARRLHHAGGAAAAAVRQWRRLRLRPAGAGADGGLGADAARPECRPVGTAIQTSIRACLANPVPMAIWGVVVAVLLFLGCIPAFIGLAVVMPVLGTRPGICTGTWWRRAFGDGGGAGCRHRRRGAEAMEGAPSVARVATPLPGRQA